MVFSWFREHHRRTIAAQPFPAAWQETLERNVAHLALLAPPEQQQLREDIQIFISEKYWEGCGGLDLTDEMRVTIAALACLLQLYLPRDYFPNVESILVYPTDYKANHKDVGPDGVVIEDMDVRLGEAWNNGPVVLSWQDVMQGARNDKDGHNVVLHEFAHKLDMRDGRADGVPALETDAAYETWADVMSREYQQLVEQSEQHHVTLLNAYGATNAAEFFAVATECFFEKSLQMRETHSALYAALRDFYKQDPAARLDALTESSS